jgi:hypothetical protein
MPGDELVEVYRDPSEVFSKRTLASGEGKPVTLLHPNAFVTPATSGAIRGHIQNLRAGDELSDGERALVADLLITCPVLIGEIESGRLRECSLGYDCTYMPLDGGRFEQSDIRINHLAVVARGRAGAEVRIEDWEGSMASSRDVLERLDVLMRMCEHAIGKHSTRSLADEVRAIRDDAAHTERLTASGVGPTTFHQELAKRNSAYREFTEQQRAGEDFAAAARRAGRELAAKFQQRACTHDAVVHQHDPEADWADMMNLEGNRLRRR